MTVFRLLGSSSASPEEIKQLGIAYRKTLHGLCLVDRNDPVSEMVARRVIEIAGTGIRDPKQISRIAIGQCDPASNTWLGAPGLFNSSRASDIRPGVAR
ncbi:hypothetical protein JQ625_01220 [Bradyrhizobium diazoefficiens]|nr:hypothetical protein [Bradyrhizobium diazoefficiens]MBR0773441.1 hypothetical protein [Bradyrhizobium diazoefficiens]